MVCFQASLVKHIAGDNVNEQVHQSNDKPQNVLNGAKSTASHELNVDTEIRPECMNGDLTYHNTSEKVVKLESKKQAIHNSRNLNSTLSSYSHSTKKLINKQHKKYVVKYLQFIHLWYMEASKPK